MSAVCGKSLLPHKEFSCVILNMKTNIKSCFSSSKTFYLYNKNAVQIMILCLYNIRNISEGRLENKKRNIVLHGDFKANFILILHNF